MKKFNLSFDDEDLTDIPLGLLEINNTYSDHEFFYHLNKTNTCHFKRMEDFIVEGAFYIYYHSVFKGYHQETKTHLTLISNKSYHFDKKKEITELFISEMNVNYLLKNNHFIGFIIKTRPNTSDFSLILHLEEGHSIRMHQLHHSQELYHLLESYE